jgi:lambda family phage tail tape measure protein
MATTFGLLINANVKGENNIKRLGNSMQGVQGKVKNLKMAVGGLNTAFKALGAALAVGAIGSFAKQTIDQADAFGKLSTRTGIAANSLQAFVNAGKLADVSQAQLETGLKSFARTSYEAAQGVATYADAYAALGVGVKKADGSLKASDDLLKEIADKFKDLPNGPEKAAIAMRLFGKSGADMITLLNGGTEALEKFNYEVSENFSQNAEYFNDQLTILQIQFDGFRKQLLDALLPALNAIIEVFSEMFATENDWTALFKVIEYGIRGTAIVIKSLIDLVDELVRGLVTSFRVIGKVLKGDFGGAMAEVGNAYKGAFDRAKKNKAQYDRLLYGTSERGTDYGGGGRGVFTPMATAPGARGSTRPTKEKKTPEQIAAEEYEKMLQKLVGTAAGFKTVTIEAVEVTKNQATAFDGVKDAAAGYLENIGSMREGIANLATTGFQGLENALTSLVATGKANFLDFARTILAATARMIIQQTILRSIMQALGAIPAGALPTSPFGGPQVVSGGTGIDGNAFGAAAFSKTLPFGFAKGGIVNKPTLFAYANGGVGRFGLAGEAGAEGILPLKRGRGGRLGVEAYGGGANVTVNVDASGSKAQGDQGNASALGRAIGAAVQAELVKQKRPGGLLA